jgi:hypothetical protein
MKTKNTFLILLLLAFSCRKELPALPDAVTPVFFVELSGGDIALNLRAGNNQVSFNDNETLLYGVKKYEAQFQSHDTTVKLTFYGGEVFSPLKLEYIENLSDFSLISVSSLLIGSIAESNLGGSTFSTVSFGITSGSNTNTFNFFSPGKYTLFCNAALDANSIELDNEVIMAYDNPYIFELRGTIIGSGPIAIIEGEILGNTSSIDRIDWSCGTNANTSSSTSVQFPPIGSANLMRATVYFADGTIRTRTIALGFENQPKIEDYTFMLEQNNAVSFSKKLVVEMSLNGQNYTSLLATDFTQGQPFLNITNLRSYTDPVTQRKSFLFTAQGLVYFKNTSTQETIPFTINLNFGLPFTF